MSSAASPQLPSSSAPASPYASAGTPIANHPIKITLFAGFIIAACAGLPVGLSYHDLYYGLYAAAGPVFVTLVLTAILAWRRSRSAASQDCGEYIEDIHEARKAAPGSMSVSPEEPVPYPALSSPGKHTVVIELLPSHLFRFFKSVPSDTTVGSMRREFSKKSGISSTNFAVLVNGKEVSDSYKVGNCHKRDDGVIVIVLKENIAAAVLPSGSGPLTATVSTTSGSATGASPLGPPSFSGSSVGATSTTPSVSVDTPATGILIGDDRAVMKYQEKIGSGKPLSSSGRHTVCISFIDERGGWTSGSSSYYRDVAPETTIASMQQRFCTTNGAHNPQEFDAMMGGRIQEGATQISACERSIGIVNIFIRQKSPLDQ